MLITKRLHAAVHPGILVGLVVAFGHGGHQDALVRAELEAGRADQVADILDDQQVKVGQIHLGQGAVQHHSVEMALATGVDLDRRRPGRRRPVGVDAGGHVAVDHAHPPAPAERGQRALDKRRLAGAWGGHDVHAKDMPVIQSAAVLLGQAIVGAQDLLNHCHTFRHTTASPSTLLLVFTGFDVDGFQPEFVPGHDLDMRSLAGRAGEGRVGHHIAGSAIEAKQLGRNALEMEPGALGEACPR